MNVIFIRHGDTDYTLANKRRLNAIEENFIPLSEKGCKQVQLTAVDFRLKKAKIIVSSPYTRALHSACIINNELQLPLYIEFDLHEWKYDIEGTNYIGQEEIDRRVEDFLESDGDYNLSNPKPWEKKTDAYKRAINVISRYVNYSPVIVISHCMLIHCLTDKDRLSCAAILEWNFQID